MKMLSTLALGLSVLASPCISSVAEAKLETRPHSTDMRQISKQVALTLVFSGEVDLKATAIQVRDVRGNLVDTGELRFGEDKRNVEIPLSGPLAPGLYSISWHAVSRSGQDDVGGYDFTIDAVGRQAPAVAQQ